MRIMADMMKPETLEPIEAEFSKPPGNLLAASYCATVISNLEGWKGVVLFQVKEHKSLAIEQLDTRVRRLENMDGISPPPPMDIPSWDSLTWRIARLHRKMPAGPVNRLTGAPTCITPTLDLLNSVTTSLGGTGMMSWPAFRGEEALESDDLLQTAAQFLGYIAGQRRFKVVGSFDLKQNCKLALNLSLDPTMNHCGGPAFPMARLVMPPRPAMPQKGCCGCCSCSCHSPSPSVLRWMTGKYDQEKRAKRTGFKARITKAFRKLAFWRRDNYDDTDSDASSITTRTSSTFWN
ncbi:hypothetical protein F5B22DRAFT_148526 [Xylaria bambusicola]|uniref:uncharacterized protein n=1 Tax=Xylaria bambusicola TaxID=326684 RepID=UPI002007EBE9|nr:uncharacterized protein F5B22DRAFT_148526 [Xylaria bambusicola]KAI0526235.1 hypothetical protein F5B22DRAFT_148526 [Xylaria bambusicola]